MTVVTWGVSLHADAVAASACPLTLRVSMTNPFSRLALVACAVVLVADAAFATEPAEANLPKVVLVGDSIRMSYAPTVAEQLKGKAEVVSSQANGGDSGNVLKRLDEWVIREQPDVVHFNCGIHDTKRFKATGKFQVSPEQYEANLREIVSRIRKETKATVLFALTTPILDERAAKTRADRDYELLQASVDQYNAIARKVMEELKVPVNNLPALFAEGSEHDASKLMNSDGVHFGRDGERLLGERVAAFVREHLPKQ